MWPHKCVAHDTWVGRMRQRLFDRNKRRICLLECIGNEDSNKVIQGESVPEPQRKLGAFTDIPNICDFARKIKGNLLPCLEA